MKERGFRRALAIILVLMMLIPAAISEEAIEIPEETTVELMPDASDEAPGPQPEDAGAQDAAAQDAAPTAEGYTYVRLLADAEAEGRAVLAGSLALLIGDGRAAFAFENGFAFADADGLALEDVSYDDAMGQIGSDVCLLYEDSLDWPLPVNAAASREGAQAEQKSPAGMAVTPDSVTLAVKQTCDLTVTGFTPSSDTDKVLYKTGNAKIATVSADGRITAKAVGSTVITAYSSADPNVSAACAVTVKAAPSGVTVDKKSATVGVNESIDLKATLKGTDWIPPMTWSATDKETVVRLTPNGNTCRVDGLAPGKSTVTVKTFNGKSAKVSIVVPDPTIPTALTLEPSGSFRYDCNYPLKLTATLEKEGVAVSEISWKAKPSGNVNIAPDGTITAKKTGSVVITATAKRNSKATASVTVDFFDPAYPTGLTLDPGGKIDHDYRVPLQIKATLLPKGEAISEITWKASPASSVVFNEDGTISAKKTGKVTITATAKKNSKAKASVVVNFYDPSIPTGLTLEPGGPIEQDYRQPLQLKATLLPKGEAESEITWKASPSGNVTITDGLVQAKKACKVTITATAKKNSKAKASVVVNFYDPTIPTALRLEPSGSFDYNYYTPLKLQVILETEGVAESEITWKANPSKNVSIAADGTITAKKFGKVTITATAKRNSKAKASVTVNFTDMSVPTGLELDKHGTIEIDLKEEVQLTATLLPAELAQSDILWSSSDPKFASVTSSGLVKGVGEGEATITATAAKNTNARDSVTFKVVDRHAPISVSIDQGDTQNMVIGGEDLTLTASLAGQEGYEPETTLTWSSSDEKVATVTQSGVVHAVGVGTTTITVTTHNGKTDSCTVEVKEPDPVMVDGIVLNETEKTLGVGETLSLTAEVSPADATNRDVIWSTNKKSVASVDENGLVTAAGAGEATITATAADGSGIKAECKITVVQKVTGITLNKDEETLDVGSTLQLTADVSPDSATNKDVTWSTSDKEVADVDENGLVTAVGAGEATITATAADGSGVKAECKVSVPFEGFTFRTLSDGTVEITGYRGTDTDLVIPATINGKTVSAIGAEAFKGNASITSVEVQSNAVTVIGQSAFENCTALVSVDLPDSVQTIGAAAFKNCVKLESMS